MNFSRLASVAALAGFAGIAVGLAPSASPAGSAAADAWKIDSVHSSLIFRIKHLNTAYFYGRFNDIGGEINWDDSDPAKASFNVEIKTSSVDSKNPGRDRHLKSGDFFNAEQFPTCTFKSTSVTPKGEHAVEVTGDLTMNGVTKPLTVTIEKTGQGPGQRGGTIVGFETVFTVKRTDFGINFMPGGLGEEVKVFASFEAGRP
jgi:polyisoprenoid-binding protein YceI